MSTPLRTQLLQRRHAQSLPPSLHSEYKHTASQYYHDRDKTPLESAVQNAVTWHEASAFVSRVPLTEQPDSLDFLPTLENCVFCGHLQADLDSIAGAIGAAHLYGGVAARASEINSETKWALEKWNCDCPPMIDELLAAESSNKNICLVDFQQQSQLHSAIPMSNIIGIIDHHALQNSTIITEKPVFVDIRPWGSACSILAHCYAVHERYLPKYIAGMLLSAILSDTLNLRSPTTTKWDERMVSMLVQYLLIDDVNVLAAAQFRAKSHELDSMTSYQLVNGDMKQFKFQDAHDSNTVYTIGYGVIETTDSQASLNRVDELIVEMQEVRVEKNLTAMLLAVVDIVNMNSSLLICGEVEKSLAVAAYQNDEIENNVMLLPNKVSRKLDFVPPLTRALNEGWKPPMAKRMGKTRRRRNSMIVMDYSEIQPGVLKRVYLENKQEEGLDPLSISETGRLKEEAQDEKKVGGSEHC